MVTYEMVGGRTCLDFVNTASQRRLGPFTEKLHVYGDLLEWAVQAEALTEAEAAHLRSRAASDPTGAEAVLVRGRVLREAIYRVFAARQAGDELPAEDLRVINEEHARAAVNRVLTPGGIGICNF
jgi:predicted RNA-binding Zn ribbon-like protein